jgi:hypothetical protein
MGQSRLAGRGGLVSFMRLESLEKINKREPLVKRRTKSQACAFCALDADWLCSVAATLYGGGDHNGGMILLPPKQKFQKIATTNDGKLKRLTTSLFLIFDLTRLASHNISSSSHQLKSFRSSSFSV